MGLKFKPYFTCRKGSNSIEMAIVILLVAALVPPFVDVVNIVNAKTKIANAVSVGSKYAISHPGAVAQLSGIVQSASSLPAQDVNVVTASVCECISPGSATPGPTVSCTSSCTGGTTLATFTSIDASYPVSLIIDYPTFTNPFPVENVIKVRVQ